MPIETWAITSLAKTVIKHPGHLLPLARSYRFLFHKKLRISMAAILDLEHNGKHILIRNRHRHEFFAPIGGVFKYLNTAQPFLDRINFTQDIRDTGDADFQFDLRVLRET